jgi:hypothetical protein
MLFARFPGHVTSSSVSGRNVAQTSCWRLYFEGEAYGAKRVLDLPFVGRQKVK